MREVHRLGVLHRDLKELNILIRADDGEPVVIDFGFGALSGAPTETGLGRVPPGTPEYRSPEIIKFLKGETEGDAYTYTLSDELWAMGVLLLNTPRAPHLVNPRVPEEASRLCLRMLEKNPQARFHDDDELCAALEALLSAAEGDASWDLPLIDPQSPNDTTTVGDPGAGETPNGETPNERPRGVQQWIAYKPRRGWLPVENGYARRLESAHPFSLAALAPKCAPRPRPSNAPQVRGRRTPSFTFSMGMGLPRCKGTRGLPERSATMKEGPLAMVLDEGWGELPEGTLLTGTLTFGEDRFFGRFTQAQTPDRQTYPVCIEAYLPRPKLRDEVPDCPAGAGDCPMPDSKPGAFKIFPRLELRPRSHFE